MSEEPINRRHTPSGGLRICGGRREGPSERQARAALRLAAEAAADALADSRLATWQLPRLGDMTHPGVGVEVGPYDTATVTAWDVLDGVGRIAEEAYEVALPPRQAIGGEGR